jgi:hypothetical protein
MSTTTTPLRTRGSMTRVRIRQELAASMRADSGSSLAIVSKMPRMMKTLTASASVW